MRRYDSRLITRVCDVTVESRWPGFCISPSSVIRYLIIVSRVTNQVLPLDSRVILNCYQGFGILIHVKKVVALELQTSLSTWHAVWDILNSRYAT